LVNGAVPFGVVDSPFSEVHAYIFYGSA